MFAVFFIKDGEWTMHLAFSSLNAAQHEASYLTKSIGVTAKVFKAASE